MKQFNKTSLWITFFVLITLLASVFFFLKQSKEDRLASLGDHVVSNFKAGLAYEMADLLSFSLALSEDGELKNALISEDEAAKGYRILSKITQRFKKYTHLKSLRLQVLSPDFFIFARSWNEGFEGMPIWWFRDDLKTLKRSKQPKVGMETGRLLTFKATIPIRSGGKLLGYLEAIKFVDEFAAKLRKKGIELFALMDERYLKQAELMRDFPQIHGYVVANQNYNQQVRDKVEELHHKNILYLLEPMYNGEGDKIGVYLLIISDSALKKYEKENQSISFFTQFSDEDIEQVVESWAHPFGSFRSGYDKDLVGLLSNLNKEDKVELESEAKEILGEYSKDELIDIIISNKHKEKKTGVIE
jgi:hypothetical protein